jgi:hypothetical protein
MSTPEQPPVPLIYGRISAVMAAVGAVGKNKRNQQQGYDFRGIDDFYDALQPALSEHKVFVTPTILEHAREERATRSGGTLMTTLTKVRFRVWTEDGSFIEADALGEGADSGDKSANKAASGALKYLFMQVFCVRLSGPGDDPENDHNEYKFMQPADQPPQPHARAPERRVALPPLPVKTAPAAPPQRKLWPDMTPAERKTALVAQCNEWPATATSVFRENDLVGPEETFTAISEIKCALLNRENAKALVSEIRTRSADAGDLAPPPPTPLQTETTVDWRAVIVPMPPEGVTKAEYMKSPRTLGQVYDEMKGGSADARKHLWGWARNYKPEPWTNSLTGIVQQPSELDIAFRVGLDAFLKGEQDKKEAQYE